MKRLVQRIALLSVGFSLYAGSASAVGTRTFDLQAQKDFEGGDLEGVAIDSSGQVRAGFNLGKVPVSQGTMIWSALPQKDGSILLGTGNEGKLVRVKGTKVTLEAESKELAITSLAEAFGGTIVAGTLPNGKLLKLVNGKLEQLAKLKDAKHIWALAYDEKSKALYVATGPDGKLYRVTQQGTATVYFDAPEKHLMSVAVGPDGAVYAGGGDKAKLYKISAPGRATVLYDFGKTEVRGIAFGKNGDVYAIANDISSGSYASSFGSGGLAPSGPAPKPPQSRGKGELYRFDKDGAPELLLKSTSEHYTSLVMGDDGKPYVGTGVEGKLYTIDDAHNSVLVADTEERMISGLHLSGKSKFLVSSDPAVLHPIRGVGGADAVWTSKVLDAGLRARFGRLSWQSSGTLELSTRTGNTKEPDDTWSAWSRGLTAAGDISSPAARYIQVRARWSRDKDAVLSEVTLPFVTDNLRAVVTQVDAKKKSSSSGLTPSGGPVTGKPNTKVSLSWKVNNPDKDQLKYRLEYRLVGTKQWYRLGKPGLKFKGTSHSWETAHLPEGKYRIRVHASDAPSNPPNKVKKHSLSSNVVIVDNTPPTVTQLQVQGRSVRGIAVDGVGPIQRIEVSLAGEDEWVPFDPNDGIFDEQREEFTADVSGLSPKGPALLSIRVYDSANNFVVQNVSLK